LPGNLGHDPLELEKMKVQTNELDNNLIRDFRQFSR
jgi:hypothetical protein